ncbi:MAG: hypothetical protein CL946_06855, partial [Ectothiorhodospiraceae bacterium]|nr:hypothetical protein [Ectothiorhodospiraceae bacterium]
MYFRRGLFELFKSQNRVTFRAERAKQGVRYLFQLIPSTFSLLFLCSLLVTALYFLNQTLVSAKLLPLIAVDSNAFIDMNIVVATICGLMMSIYYAAVVTIISTKYNRIDDSLRGVLVSEGIGIPYLTYLGICVLLSMISVGFELLGLALRPIGVFVSVILIGVSVGSFLQLGRRVFRLFNPGVLLSECVHKLVKLVEGVTSGDVFSDYKVFQKFSREQAVVYERAMQALLDIYISDQSKGNVCDVSIHRQLMAFLTWYVGQKTKIPTDSLWYEEKYLHREWYRSSDSWIGVPTDTFTTLQPEVIGSMYWLEESILGDLVEVEGLIIRSDDQNVIYEMFKGRISHIEMVSQKGDVEHAMELIEGLLENISQSFGVMNGVDHNLTIISATELLCYASIEMLVYLRRFQEYWNDERIELLVSSLMKGDEKQIYKSMLTPKMLKDVELLQSNMIREIEIEGEVVTAQWFVRDYLRLLFSRTLCNISTILTTRMSALYDRIYELAGENDWQLSAACSRELEYLYKLSRYNEQFYVAVNKLKENVRVVGFDWPKYQAESLRVLVSKRRRVVYNKISTLCPRIIAAERDPSVPDYPGQFLHGMGYYIMDNLKRGLYEEVWGLFKSYLPACILMHCSLMPSKVVNIRAKNELIIAYSPLMDLMYITGIQLMVYMAENEEER